MTNKEMGRRNWVVRQVAWICRRPDWCWYEIYRPPSTASLNKVAFKTEKERSQARRNEKMTKLMEEAKIQLEEMTRCDVCQGEHNKFFKVLIRDDHSVWSHTAWDAKVARLPYTLHEKICPHCELRKANEARERKRLKLARERYIISLNNTKGVEYGRRNAQLDKH